MNRESVPLLKTKFHIPPRRPNLVFRPRLMDRMEDALRLRYRLTLISARAGAGKTTLVSEWLHQQKRPSAWLSLDENDNDPWRFFSYLVETLRQQGIAASHTVLGALETSEIPPAEVLITELINDIAANAPPFILVLDDYHVIHNDWIHQALGFLVEHQPLQMHLVLTTRVDPPLPFAQLRVRGQLAEIRDRDLLFTAGEVAEFLNELMELDLSAEAVAMIQLRTEGWIAGMQMAAISARGHKQDGDLGAFIEAFSGTSRFVLDYLTEEVLNRQAPAVQDFLIETSMLERMCGGLCDAVRSGAATEHDSQSILAQLERANLFVIPLDDERRWYRYHHLFADLLQSILRQRRSTEQINELHRRASQWYLDEELPGEAMTHILAARDFERAASVIDENIAGLIHMFSRNQTPLLLSWIEKLPEEIRRSRPWIDVYRANMLALNLQLADVDPILDDVEKRIEPGSPRALEILGHVAAIRAYSANLRGDAARAITLANLAKEYLPGEEYLFARTMVAYTLADTYFAGDDMENARQALSDFLSIGKKAGQLIIIVPALCDLATIRKVQGQLYRAEALYDQAHQWLVNRHGLESRFRCSYEFGLADLLRELNQLNEARQHAMTGIEYRRRFGGYNLLGDLALMRVLQAYGDVEGAMSALRNAELAAQTYPFQLALTVEFRAARVVQWLTVGDTEMASRCAEECSGGTEQERIVLARLWLAQGRISDAQELLVQQRLLAETGGRTGRLIEILGLQAIAFASQSSNSEKALQVLDQALGLAEPEGFVRTFLDKGAPMVELLRRTVAQGLHVSYAMRLLNALGEAATASQPLIEALSERELEVLRRVAAGYSNNDIAQELVVAVSTVKKHINNIYSKLEVRSRTQAVARARELGLL
ncbi:MAG: LuxR family transcriptional regulator [Anaerolineae bacterium]|nr:LuxR family transcriptional regulator [Anaerolineae bacterium]